MRHALNSRRYSTYSRTVLIAEVELTDESVHIRIHCPTGIGYCDMAPEHGSWPERVTILFEGIDELEHLELAFGRMHAQGSRSLSGKFEFDFLDAKRDFNKRSKAGTLDVKVERKKEGVLVTLPGKLLAEKESLHLGWINWLRR